MDAKVSKAKNLYESGMTLIQVADNIGVSHSTVDKWFRKHGIPTRSIKKAKELRNGNILDEEIIVELYNQGMLIKDIALEVGYEKSTVGKLLRNTKLEITNPNHSTNTKNTIKNKEFLYHQYVTLEKTQEQIAEEFGGSSNMVMRHLKKFNIPTRSGSDAIKLSFKNGRNIPIQRKNPRGKGRWVNLNGENVYMKSTWEVEVAKYLFLNGYNFKYEEVRFDLGDYTYTPDFFIYDEKGNLQTVIEVKGWYKDKAARKMMTFQTLYPEIDYYVWDREVMSLIKKEFKEEVA